MMLTGQRLPAALSYRSAGAMEIPAVWNAVMEAATALHPIVRACLAFHLWPLSGIGLEGDILEGAVTSIL